MYLSVDQCLDAIERHTRGLAVVAETDLAARIEHCPEWSMADLVWHLTGVHRFWEHIARERPSEAPELPEVPRPADEELVPGLLAGMETLGATLRAADQDAPCWTWGLEENVRFITRHQVQEAAVHHWDALNAVGTEHIWNVEDVAAIDAVDEFLTHSVGNRRWPKEDAEPIGGTVWFRPSTADAPPAPTWRITDGEQPGTVRVTVGGPDEIAGPVTGHHVDPARLLLWLYRRVPEPGFDPAETDEGRDLIHRFQALTYTD